MFPWWNRNKLFGPFRRPDILGRIDVEHFTTPSTTPATTPTTSAAPSPTTSAPAPSPTCSSSAVKATSASPSPPSSCVAPSPTSSSSTVEASPHPASPAPSSGLNIFGRHIDVEYITRRPTPTPTPAASSEAPSPSCAAVEAPAPPPPLPKARNFQIDSCDLNADATLGNLNVKGSVSVSPANQTRIAQPHASSAPQNQQSVCPPPNTPSASGRQRMVFGGSRASRTAAGVVAAVAASTAVFANAISRSYVAFADSMATLIGASDNSSTTAAPQVMEQALSSNKDISESASPPSSASGRSEASRMEGVEASAGHQEVNIPIEGASVPKVHSGLLGKQPAKASHLELHREALREKAKAMSNLKKGSAQKPVKRIKTKRPLKQKKKDKLPEEEKEEQEETEAAAANRPKYRLKRKLSPPKFCTRKSSPPVKKKK